MKKKKIAGFLGLGAIVFALAQFNVHAEIDYSKDEAHYQKLCAKQSSFNANKKACTGYESYLKSQKNKIKQDSESLKNQISATKNEIENLKNLIQKNDALIAKKTAMIKKTEEDIKIKMEEIAKLENDIIDRIGLMQEVNSENFLVDFLMNFTSLDDLIVKMDGMKAINNSQHDAIVDLDYVKKQLAKKQASLKQDKKELEDAQKIQNEMMISFRSKEAELFKKLEEQRKKSIQYDKKLDTINVKDIAKSRGLINPIQHATVTATAWYYPASFGGGWHPGIDLANNSGTPVRAAANGIILYRGFESGGYGNFVVAAYQVGNDTYTLLHGHLTSSLNLSKVKQGQVIGYMGSTGNSTGPHTHVEIIKHKNKSLAQIRERFKNTGDIYFGLGYDGIGSCSNVCRLKPHEFFGIKYYQVY